MVFILNESRHAKLPGPYEYFTLSCLIFQIDRNQIWDSSGNISPIEGLKQFDRMSFSCVHFSLFFFAVLCILLEEAWGHLKVSWPKKEYIKIIWLMNKLIYHQS